MYIRRCFEYTCVIFQNRPSRIGGVMVWVHDCAVDRDFEPRSGQTKCYKIGIWCFSATRVVFRSKSKVVGSESS